MSVADALEPHRVGVRHEALQERVLIEKRSHPRPGKVQDVGAGGEEVDDVEVGQTGMDAFQDGPGRSSNQVVPEKRPIGRGLCSGAEPVRPTALHLDRPAARAGCSGGEFCSAGAELETAFSAQNPVQSGSPHRNGRTRCRVADPIRQRCRSGNERCRRSRSWTDHDAGVVAMMRPEEGVRVYVCQSRVDMRKSINGLSAMVEGVLSLDPFAPHLFVFCNRRSTQFR
jgi:hypothetical protein